MAGADPAGYDGLLLTSANAVRHGGTGAGEACRICRSMPLALRPRTAARGAGFAVETVGDERRCRPCSATLPRVAPAAASGRRGSSRHGRSDGSTAGSSIGPPQSQTRTCPPLERLGRGGAQPARRAAAGRARRPTAAPPPSPRSARRPREACGRRLGAGRGRRAPNDQACWPSPRCCVTHRRHNDRQPRPPRHVLDRPHRLGAAAALRRRGAGDLGPVALGSRRPLLRRCRQASRCRSSASPRHFRRPRSRPSEPLAAADAARIATLEGRLAAIESQAQAAAGSAGRADAMLVAFAARRAIDRGVALGYLEPLLVQRFGQQHQAAVATIVTASRDPVRLDSLIADYEALGPSLRGGGPEEGWWDALPPRAGHDRLDSTAPIRRRRSRRRATTGRWRGSKRAKSTPALAETMRLPGAANAAQWIVRARRYIAAHRALDEIESAALARQSSARACQYAATATLRLGKRRPICESWARRKLRFSRTGTKALAKLSNFGGCMTP